MHTSVVEYLVRSGVAGVLIVACPPRDCWSREGPKWLYERLYHDRAAELPAALVVRRALELRTKTVALVTYDAGARRLVLVGEGGSADVTRP